MWTHFYLENIHFALSMLAALVMFAVSWLHYDSWSVKKSTGYALRVAGYLLIGISFVMQAVYLESTIVQVSYLGIFQHTYASSIVRVVGYVLLLVSLMSEREVARPAASAVIISSITPLTASLLCAYTAYQYLRRATVGLENHLKLLAYGFYVLTLYELLTIHSAFLKTQNIDLYAIVAPFGPIWIVAQIVLLGVIVVFGMWVWRYLLTRLQTQLLIILTTAVFVIFLVTTVAFTGLLLGNIQQEAIGQLRTNVRVLNMALDSRRSELISDADALAGDSRLHDYIRQSKRTLIQQIAQSTLVHHKLGSTMVVDADGQVIVRAEDPGHYGDSQSSDTMVRQALDGTASSSIVTREGIIAPTLSVAAAAPIMDGNHIIGAVICESPIDNAFVDTIKSSTGLESSIYADRIIAATTFTTADGHTRMVGYRGGDDQVARQVLGRDQEYAGHVTLRNTSYLGAYAPLVDHDRVPVGMLFAGRRESSVLAAAGQSLEYTFIVSAILMIVSTGISYSVARYIAEQLS